MRTKLTVSVCLINLTFCLIINGQENKNDAVLKYKYYELVEVDDNVVAKPLGKLSLKEGFHRAKVKYGLDYSTSINITNSGFIPVTAYSNKHYFSRIDGSTPYYSYSRSYISEINFHTESGKTYLTDEIYCSYIDTVSGNLFFNWPYFQIIENETKEEVGGITNTIKTDCSNEFLDTIFLFKEKEEIPDNLAEFVLNFNFNSLSVITGRNSDGDNVHYSYTFNDKISHSRIVHIFLKPGYYYFTQFFEKEQDIKPGLFLPNYALHFKAEPRQIITNTFKTDPESGSLLQCNKPSFKNMLINDLYDICFLPDGDHGWMVGDNGIILKTEDGGNEWRFQKISKSEYIIIKNDTIKGLKKLQPTLSNLNDAFFLDSLYGWITTEHGEIFKTNDGGRNWSYGDCKNCTDRVFFINEKEGYASGHNGWGWMIMETHDGGVSWKTISKSASGADYFFRNHDDWLCVRGGMPGVFLSSVDKGVSWVKKNTDKKLDFSSDVNDFLSIDDNQIWLLYSFGIMCTEDNGITWNYYKMPSYYKLNSLWFTDRKTGYAVGNNGVILRTNDGGKTWENLKSGTSEDLNDIHFIDKKGWAIGSNGVILTTNDSGSNWRYMNILDFVQNDY